MEDGLDLYAEPYDVQYPVVYVEKTELGGTDRFEGHTIPQPLNPLREPVDEMFPATFVNVGGA
jgi:hypothetical protein